MYYAKLFFQLCVWLALLACLIWYGFRAYIWLSTAEPITPNTAQETRSNVHWLDPEKPLVYTVSASQTLSLRVLTNAIFKQYSALELTSELTTDYAIEYTLLNDSNKVITKHTYHHTSKLALDAEQQKVKQIIENKTSLAVSSGQSFYIKPEQLKQASRIALRLIPEDQSLTGVVVRLHAKISNSVDDKNRAWLKLPVQWRERTINYHTIGVNALSEQEMNNAVTFDWLKLAPQGIPDIDFKTDTLYETLPYHILSYDFESQHIALDKFYTYPNFNASFRILEKSTISARIEGEISNLTLTWIDLAKKLPPKILTIEQAAPNRIRVNDVAPGLIIISSSSVIQTRWWLNDDMPVLPLHSYYYAIDSNLPAHFKVTPNSDLSIEFRGNKGDSANIEVFDEQQRHTVSFSIKLEGLESTFDRAIASDTLRLPITEAERFYVRLPSNAHTVSITGHSMGEQLVGVKLQARMRTFNYQQLLCHSICNLTVNDFTEVGAWFSQKAHNDFEFAQQQRLMSVRIFESPPEPPPEMSFYTGYDLSEKLPRSNVALVQNQPNYFDLQQPYEDYQFRPVSIEDLSLDSLEPSLAARFRLIIKSPQVPYYTEYKLSELNNNLYDEIRAKQAVLYSNIGKQRHWHKQRLFMLKKSTPLRLVFSQRPHSIVLKTYATTLLDEPLLIDTQLSGNIVEHLTDEYTIMKRRYALVEQNPNDAFMLHPSRSALYSYPAITIPINNDVKQLQSITIESEQDIWLSIFEQIDEPQLDSDWWRDEIH
ncbi:hypothetical protein PSECIP111951_03068 [Pseudoalteromonas holothuriae]|uniref:Uncharacterized protein n=1 Tax=Pseudoalteromonas holothuriae TaxID=2963714 RepID=A0ABM9GKX9_9GAMM|nr:hypothetical protein [Pseudoalteromonas sp. CIP111951]CAH9064183.1 hypothetical protein PSECIP111951_03068 [Pseudoalteromonas sp. CIP111951]